MTATTLYNLNPSDWTDKLASSSAAAAQQRALDTFLAGVERRAFVMAELATRNREEALDLVQDAMLAFVASYGNKPQAEWPPLFHRVLQNRIRDWGRRNTVRSRWRVWLKGHDDEPEADPLQQAADPAGRTPEGEFEIENKNGEEVKVKYEAWSNSYNIFVLIWKKRRLILPRKRILLNS